MSKLDGFTLQLPPIVKPAGIGKGGIVTELPGLRAGTQITCPQCKDSIGELRRDLYHSMTVAADSIRFQPHQHRSMSEPAICKKCGATFMAIEASVTHGRRLRVHTALGWI